MQRNNAAVLCGHHWSVHPLYDRPEKMSFIVGAILSLAIHFSWAAVIFIFQRFRYDGREDTKVLFLERYYEFFTKRITKPPYQELNSKVLREKGWSGMGMIGMPIILMGLDVTLLSVFLSVSLLFFSGLCLALSWFAGRCLRQLGLDSFTPTGRIKSARSTRSPSAVD